MLTKPVDAKESSRRMPPQVTSTILRPSPPCVGSADPRAAPHCSATRAAAPAQKVVFGSNPPYLLSCALRTGAYHEGDTIRLRLLSRSSCSSWEYFFMKIHAAGGLRLLRPVRQQANAK